MREHWHGGMTGDAPAQLVDAITPDFHTPQLDFIVSARTIARFHTRRDNQ